MSEAKLFATNGFGGGLSAGIRADNYDEFVALAKQVYGDTEGVAFAQSAFGQLLAAAPVAQAVQNLNNNGVPVQVVNNDATGNVYQMPQRPTQQAQQLPPGVQDPGPCAHGPRQFRSSQTKRGTWNRWECAIPWSRDAVGRCPAINA